jgi:predicted MFS family arabinose efflux permease
VTDEPTTAEQNQDAGIWSTFRATSTAVRAILLGIFLSRLGSFLQTFLVLFLTHRGFSKIEAGTALGGYGVGSVLGVLVGGVLADRLGARIATIVSMAGSGLMLLTILYIHNYPLLFAMVVAIGLVAQLYRPASAALLSELTPKHRQVMIFAIYRLAFNLGTTIAPLIAVALIAVSYNLLFWAEAITACGYAVIAAIALPRRKIVRAAKEGDEVPSAGGIGYRLLLADRRYLLYLVVMFVFSAAYVQFVVTMPLAMKDARIATAWFGAMITLNGVMVLSCELLVTKLVQRWPRRIAATGCLLLLGAALTILTPRLGLIVFVLATVLGTLSEIVGGPTLFSYPGIAARPGTTARYMAAMQTAFGLGAAAGPAVGVAAWNALGRGSWWLWGLVCIASTSLAWLGLRDDTPDDTADEDTTEARPEVVVLAAEDPAPTPADPERVS